MGRPPAHLVSLLLRGDPPMVDHLGRQEMELDVRMGDSGWLRMKPPVSRWAVAPYPGGSEEDGEAEEQSWHGRWVRLLLYIVPPRLAGPVPVLDPRPQLFLFPRWAHPAPWLSVSAPCQEASSFAPPDSTTANATVGLDVTWASQTCPSLHPQLHCKSKVRKYSSPSPCTTSVRKSPSSAPKSTSAHLLSTTTHPNLHPSPRHLWWWLVPSLPLCLLQPAPSHTDCDQGQVPPPSNLPLLQEGGNLFQGPAVGSI